MPELRLPDRHREAIVSVLALPADKGAALLKQMQDCDGKSASVIAILDDVLGHGSGRNVFRSLVQIALIPRRFSVPAEVIDAAVKSTFKQTESQFPLGDLLTSKPLQQFAKALDLRSAYERILLSSRVVSDIRPLFDDDEVEDDIEAAMVNHTLQLRVRVAGREPEDVHIAVDLENLKTLKRQIDRSLQKDIAARRLIEKGEAIVLEELGASE